MSAKFAYTHSYSNYHHYGQELPERKTIESAGYDLYCNETVALPPKTPKLLPTGVKCYLDKGTFLQLQLRSSIPMKYPIIMTNAPGIIDADYVDNPKNEGEIFVQVMNYSDEEIIIPRGERIAQGIILEYQKIDNDATQAQRRGGIGSTNE